MVDLTSDLRTLCILWILYGHHEPYLGSVDLRWESWTLYGQCGSNVIIRDFTGSLWNLCLKNGPLMGIKSLMWESLLKTLRIFRTTQNCVFNSDKSLKMIT